VREVSRRRETGGGRERVGESEKPEVLGSMAGGFLGKKWEKE